MTWTGQNFSVGQILTAAQMNNLQADISAVANGDAGAPPILQAALGAGCVHTTELNTSTGTTSTPSATLVFTMSGGMYVFAVQTYISNGSYNAFCYGGNATTNTNPYTGSTSYVTNMAIGSSNTLGTAYAQYRYINSSPPYDLGDGEIPLFIFALLNKNGSIEAVSVAKDPVWHGNGPTDVTPSSFTKEGIPLIKVKDIKNIPRHISEDERIIALLEAPSIEIPITQEYKNCDMNIIPHPFLDNDLTDKVVVMLDPVSNIMEQLADLHDHKENINSMIHSEYIQISNSSLSRCCPSAVTPVSIKWKLTR